VEIENNVLSLRGERKMEKETEEKGYRRIERSYGNFSRSFTLPQNASVNVQQLVVYVLASRDGQSVDAHLAWEIDVANGPIKTIYLDAMTEQVIAVN